MRISFVIIFTNDVDNGWVVSWLVTWLTVVFVYERGSACTICVSSTCMECTMKRKTQSHRRQKNYKEKKQKQIQLNGVEKMERIYLKKNYNLTLCV